MVVSQNNNPRDDEGRKQVFNHYVPFSLLFRVVFSFSLLFACRICRLSDPILQIISNLDRQSVFYSTFSIALLALRYCRPLK